MKTAPWSVVEAARPYLLGVLLLAAVVPVWLTDWLPLQEHGLFLAHLDIAWRSDDPSTAYVGRFIVPDGATAQSLSVWFSRALGPLVGTVVTAKILLSMAVIGLPLGALTVARGLGRSPWMAVAVVPLAWGAVMRVGLVDLALGLPLALFAVASASRLAERPSLVPTLGVVALLLLSFYAHLFAFIAGWVLSLMVVLMRCRWRRVLTLSPLWVLPLPLAGFSLARGFGSSPVSHSVSDHMTGLLSVTTDFFSDSWDEWVLVVTAVAWLVAMLSPSASHKHSDTVDANRRSHALSQHIPEALTFCCAWTYLLAPTSLKGVYGHFGYGAATLTLVFFWMWPRCSAHTTPRRVLASAVWVVATAYIVVVNIRMVYFERYTVDRLEPLMAVVPEAANLAFATQLHGAWPTGGSAIAGLHAGMHAVHNGGVSHRLLANRPSASILFKADKKPSPFDATWIGSESLYEFDHLLLDTTESADSAEERRGVELVYESGPWRLYSVSPPPRDVTFVMAPPKPDAAPAPVWNATCPKRYRLVGLKASFGRSGAERIQPLCRRYAGKQASPKPIHGKALGESDETSEQMLCARGSEVVALEGRMGRRVETLAVRCSENTMVSNTMPQTPLGTALGGRAFDLRCPPGTHGRGLRARVGQGISSVGIICGM